MLGEAMIDVAPTPRAALFLVGKAFQQNRAAGGARTGVLPDFFIGAHAAIEGWPLLTRDARRYHTYFPKITLIAPPESGAAYSGAPEEIRTPDPRGDLRAWK